MIETEKLKKQREARLAAEALFDPIAQPPQTVVATVVTVRHRRASPDPTQHLAAVSSDTPHDTVARAPRIHLVAAEPAAATTDTDTAAEAAPKASPLAPAPLEAISTDAQPPEAPAVNAEPALPTDAPVAIPPADPVVALLPPKPRKTRRVSMAAVAVESRPVEKSVAKRMGSAPRRSAPSRQDLDAKGPQDHASSVQHVPTKSGFDAYEWPVYPKLIARIEELKRKAYALRERESAQALVWIKGAIRQYGLSAQDLGFTKARDSL